MSARDEAIAFDTGSRALHVGATHADHSALDLGRRLLIGEGMSADPQRGLSLIRDAARQGSADACNLLATLTAAGAWTEQSWLRALDLLQQAAERGSIDAREQLTLLATDPNASSWRARRESIDLERFVTPPQPQQICGSPRIWRADGFASPAQCDRLMARAHGKLAPAKMYDRVRHTVQFNAIRTNSEFLFDITQASVMLVLMRIKIGLLVSLPVPHMEPPQILHYAPGQELRAHYDFLRAGEAGYGRDAAYCGDRVVTFLLYLNDGYEGGETHFPKADLRYKGRKGDAIFFANLRSGRPDPMSLHSGTPIVRGEKWLFSQWIHDRPFTA
ncbi:MAG TPA: 2OG-Fe(II) oxygenase [Rhizomicrobium sp.]|nr:2OG-Fe(II) oxygenase [Rhizomicrobium sp.]